VSERRAWIVPTHGPNFAHTARLLDSAQQHGISGTWIPVFSTSNDAADFYRAHPRQGVHYVVEDLIGPGRLLSALERRSIVNVKKFVALWELRSHFDVMHVIDTECVVLRSGDPMRSFLHRESQRAWPAHPHTDPVIRGIQLACVGLFDVRDRRRLLGEVLTDRFLYSWFEDIPTYRTQDLSGFFEYFGATDDVTALTDVLSWETFEHLLYQYFCCLHRGWNLVDTGMPSPDISVAWWETWKTEDPLHRANAAEHVRRWSPSWVRYPEMLQNSENAFMAYHQEVV
jgi:hypothetical protein